MTQVERANVLELDLPEIADRDPYHPPTSHLEKTGANAWSEVPGRRESRTLLVNQMREAVDVWREQGYQGVTDTTRRLLTWWFEEDHLLAAGTPFRYYFCQQEAVETAVYLFEVEGIKDAGDLVSCYFKSPDLLELDILTSSKGQRYIRRYIPEISKTAEQELPPENLARYAVKMATGSGKTVVMGLLIAWSYLNRRLEAGVAHADNFLMVAPNVIVYERLREDFDSARIFHRLPVIPPEWKNEFALVTILRGDAREPSSSGNLFLTNIQQIYEDNGPAPGPINPVAALLGKAPRATLDTAIPMLERVKRLPNLMVLNDEAHHVHDDDLAWNQTLLALHDNLKRKSGGGLTLWLDFSATPKNQNGTFFPWIVVDYPLAQAVEDHIVKAPLIIHQTDKKGPDKYASEEAGDVYNEWIAIAVKRWREHVKDYGAVGEKPLLFIMAESTKDAGSIAERLQREPEFKGKDRVLVIHTDKVGEITKKDLDLARQAAREVDEGHSRIRAIVSVLMLREGWDVRNVSVILGLRPFTAKASILPEQAIGRGLRLMHKVPPGNNQILELIGTNAFESFIRELEKEGVGVPTTTRPPKPGREVFPLADRIHLDIAIPHTTPLYERAYTRLAELDPLGLPPLAKEEDLDAEIKNCIDLVHGIVDVKVGSDEVEFNEDNLPPVENLLSSLTGRVEKRAKLPGRFAEIYPKVREYVRTRCFGGIVELDDAGVRRALNHSALLDAIAGLFSRMIGQLTIEATPVKLQGEPYKLSDTPKFLWRRMAVTAQKTIFNVVACYNPFEAEFGVSLDGCGDIECFSALAEWFTYFHVQYLSGTGTVRLYYPDFVAIQKTKVGMVNWIIETKGREFDDTDAKAVHMVRWCAEVSKETGETWRYVKVAQTFFEEFVAKGPTRSFQSLLDWKHPQGILKT
jgi:type III restriction enzyme